jgi:hypothetical protein
MKTVIEMAREAGAKTPRSIWPPTLTMSVDFSAESLQRFAEMVRADERNRTWTQEHWTEYEYSIAAAENEACAKVCDADGTLWGKRYAAAIRARRGR